MKCGCCKGDHQTVAQVKLCYNRKGTSTPVQHERPGEPRFQPAHVRRDARRQGTWADVRRLGAKIEPGGYAIRNTGNGPNDISFYEVRRVPSGAVFVSRRSSDETIRLSLAETLRVLAAIAADPQGASLLFGQRLGHCGVCGRSLTTKESRDLGIGPKCAKRMGWLD